MSEDSKSKPSSDSCSISVINVFKKGQKLLQMQLSENMWDKLSCWPPQGHWRRKRKSRCWRDSLAAYGEEHGEAGSPWSSRVEGYPPAAPGPPHTRAAGWPKEAVTLWEAYPEAYPGKTCGFMEREAHTGAGVRTYDPMGQAVPEELHHLEGATLEQFVKNWSLLKHSMLEKLMEDLSPPWRDPMLKQGGIFPPLKEKGAGETACDELTIAPILHPSASLGG